MSAPHRHRYTITYSAPARRALRRLPDKVAAAVVEFVSGPVADNPHRISKPLHNELAAYRGARRGDYRIILGIDDAAHTVIVAAVDHRAHIYRPR